MAMRGRPAKPTALKLLDGDRRDRINHEEPIPAEVDLAEPPPYLSDEAADVWRQIAPDRIRQKVLTVWDVEAFAAFCESLIILRSAHKGALVLAKPGQESPMAKFRQAVAVSSTLGGRFGWTPADRQKLVVGGGSEGHAQGAERLLG